MQVENLFYNTTARLSALRSSSEEYARILDVLTKYAVHNAGVSFVCKKVRAGARPPWGICAHACPFFLFCCFLCVCACARRARRRPTCRRRRRP